MVEVAEEVTYVRPNRHKIACIFFTMRRFRDDLHERLRDALLCLRGRDAVVSSGGAVWV